MLADREACLENQSLPQWVQSNRQQGSALGV